MKIGAVLKVNGVILETTNEGFLSDLNDWNHNVAREIARINGIVLEEGHWEIVLFIRNYYQQFLHLPNARVFTKAIGKQLGADKGNSRYLHRLFPDGPLKYACKIAGLPKPPTCL
jgi:tRNA 2-thiouridine synthesizing protein E